VRLVGANIAPGALLASPGSPTATLVHRAPHTTTTRLVQLRRFAAEARAAGNPLKEAFTKYRKEVLMVMTTVSIWCCGFYTVSCSCTHMIHTHYPVPCTLKY
jgi:hypothetical protein